MRCLTLATELSRRGATIHFVSRQLPGYLEAMLVGQNIGFTRIGSHVDPVESDGLTHAEWLGTTQDVDAAQSRSVLGGSPWDWLIVDHYGLGVVWEQRLRPIAKKIAVIDDIADRFHDCDVLLDQNYYENSSERYRALVPDQCQLLLGPEFALLREEFRELRYEAKYRSGQVRRVFVFFGGVDKENYTLRVMEALASLDLSSVAVDIVVGKLHSHLDEIQRLCLSLGFTCHVQTNKMAQLMSSADLAIGAGGGALWERCCLRLPSFVIPTAQNQEKQVMDVACKGGIYAPQLNMVDTDQLSRQLSVLLENPALLRSLSQRASDFVDGRGLFRVASFLMGQLIGIRRATLKDSENIFKWRNMSHVRYVSRSRNLIPLAEHHEWLSSTISSEVRHLLIGYLSGTAVGVVRFDVKDAIAEVSIYLTPEMLGFGLGGYLLKRAEEWLVRNVHGICQFRAVVLGSNERSRKLFMHTGYLVDQTQFSKQVS
jgi:UDP-2,4-diacetamido-2,4,6-trideoxy-beta-L-altropyranose hydrolase